MTAAATSRRPGTEQLFATERLGGELDPPLCELDCGRVATWFVQSSCGSAPGGFMCDEHKILTEQMLLVTGSVCATHKIPCALVWTKL